MLQRFQAANARIELVLNELNSQEQVEALVDDELDIAFLHTDRVPQPLASALVDDERFVACVPEGHAVACQRKVALSSLAEDAFLLFSRTVAPDYFARIIERCHHAGFYPRVRHEVRHWLSVVAVVAQGMGVSVVPSPMQRSGIRGAVFRPLTDPAIHSKVFCAWNAAADLPARDRLLKAVRSKTAS